LKRFYDVSYINGKYIIQISPEYEIVGFYTDNKSRKRPITKSRRRVRRAEPPRMKIISPEPKERTKKIIRKTSYSKIRPSKIIRNWWIPEVEQLYQRLKKFGSKLTPIHVMALFREVRKRRPEWSYSDIYEYLDRRLDASLSYDEMKTIIINDLGRTPEESIHLYDKPLSEEEIEKLYQDYLKDIEDLDIPEEYEAGDISLLEEPSSQYSYDYDFYFDEVRGF
jgi:hypothetical protein